MTAISIADLSSAANLVATLGVVEMLGEHAARGLNLLRRALAGHRELDDEAACASDLMNLAELFRRTGRWDRVVRLERLAGAIYENIGARQSAAAARGSAMTCQRIAELAGFNADLN